MAISSEIRSISTHTQAKTDASGELRPTLLIGLGGSGKEVLMRLRRMFFEKYRLKGWPIMDYLWYDTDTQAGGIGGRSFDAIEEMIDFDHTERIEARVPREKTNAMWRNQGENPHLKRWLDYDRLASAASLGIVDGAKQIRPFGRLSFYMKYAEIERSLRGKLAHLEASKTKDDTRKAASEWFSNMEIDETQREIIIIGSLAGGTGAGTFLDFGFLCKHLTGGNDMVTGIFFLPQTFDGIGGINQDATYGNGYAALLELNHYLLPKVEREKDDDGNLKISYREWPFEWKPGSEVDVAAPPFDVPYILENAFHSGGKSGDPLDVFQMVAESLLLDFEGSELSRDKRSWRSNALTYLNDETIYVSKDDNGKVLFQESFPNRFCSFGLVQLQLNKSLMANAGAYRFAQGLVGFWMKQNDTGGFTWAPETYELTEAHLNSAFLKRTDGQDMIALETQGLQDHLDKNVETVQTLIGKLQSTNQMPNQYFLDILQTISAPTGSLRRPQQYQTWQEIADAVLQAFPQYFQQFQKEIRDIIQTTQQSIAHKVEIEGQTGMQTGMDTSTFSENLRIYQKDVKQRIRAQVISYLSNPVSRGVAYADRFLKEVENHLDDLQRTYQPLETQAITPIELATHTLSAFTMPSKEMLDRMKTLRKDSENMLPFPFWKQMAIKHFMEREREEQTKLDMDYQHTVRTFLLNALEDMLGDIGTRHDGLKAWIRDTYIKTSANYILEALEAIKNDVVNLAGQIDRLEQNLRGFQTDFSELFDSFNSPVTSDRNYYINLGWQKEDYDQALKQFFDEDLNKVMATHTQHEFFQRSEPHLLPNDIEEGQGLVAGMEAVLMRSANRDNNAFAWEEVKQALENHSLRSLAGFRGLKEDISVANHLEELGRQNPQELNRILENAISHSDLRIKPNTYPAHLFENMGREQRILGIHDASHPIADLITEGGKGLSKRFEVNKPDIKAYGSDSIILYYERVGFPIFFAGGGQNDGLDALQRAYNRNAMHPDELCKRHFDKNFDDLRDILPPHNEREIRRIAQAYEPIIMNILLGQIRFSDQMGFYRQFDNRGKIEVERYGSTLIKVIKSVKSEELMNLRGLYPVILDKWRVDRQTSKYYRLIGLLLYLVNQVFRDDRDLLRMVLVQLLDRFITEVEGYTQMTWTGDDDRTGLRDEIADLLGRYDENEVDPISTNDFSLMNDFSTEIKYQGENMNAPMRVLKL